MTGGGAHPQLTSYKIEPLHIHLVQHLSYGQVDSGPCRTLTATFPSSMVTSLIVRLVGPVRFEAPAPTCGSRWHWR